MFRLGLSWKGPEKKVNRMFLLWVILTPYKLASCSGKFWVYNLRERRKLIHSCVIVIEPFILKDLIPQICFRKKKCYTQ